MTIEFSHGRLLLGRVDRRYRRRRPRCTTDASRRTSWLTSAPCYDVRAHARLSVTLSGANAAAAAAASRTRETGRDLGLESVFAAGTVEAASAKLREAPAAGSPPSLVRLTRPAKPLVLCVHSLVGTALRYREFARALDGEIEVRAFQAPGAFAGERPLHSISALAARYIEELAHAPRGRPFSLVGYSLGGLVAFEMACLLEECRTRPTTHSTLLEPPAVTLVASDLRERTRTPI